MNKILHQLLFKASFLERKFNSMNVRELNVNLTVKLNVHMRSHLSFNLNNFFIYKSFC